MNEPIRFEQKATQRRKKQLKVYMLYNLLIQSSDKAKNS